MRAVLCRSFSGPEHLELGEAPDPVPADDEIMIDVHAASVTYMDHLLVSGGYQMRPPTPFVPGTEAAGVVVGVGSKVTRFKPGDRVACLSWIGGFGERMVAKEWKSVRVPDAVSFETAATVIHSYDTPTMRSCFGPGCGRARPSSLRAPEAVSAWRRSTLRAIWADGSLRWWARIVMRRPCASAG